jgi:alkanesulfonate monooxygenase SsuD/methylene tetrahydromethanopterin reductase-like flavin-dependent oxidoreductase (luciferase family)
VAEVHLGVQGSGQWPEGLPDPGFFRAVSETAEGLGYDSLWAGEHLSFHNPILDVTVALSTFAAHTKRITIGAGVVLLPLRHPSLVAKAFGSLDWLCGGRVVLGIGVGGEGGKDFEAAGVPLEERGARTDEAIAALRELLAGGSGSFSGRFFRFDGVSIEPNGAPPIWVGGRSGPAVRRAAAADGWMPIWVSAERFARGLGKLPERVTRAVVLPALVGDDACERLARHLAERYAMSVEPHLVDRYCCAGTAEQCAARVREYADAGAEHVIFNLGCGADEFLEQMELLRSVA